MLTYYKPNKANRGMLASFKLVSRQSRDNEPFKEGCVYLNLVRQTDWNAEKRTGSFKNGDGINVKFNIFELGKWLGAIERNGKFDTFHDSKDKVTITFAPWMDKNTGEQVGFALYVNRTREGAEDKFSIAFRLGEEVALREFFKLAIEHILLSNYAEEKRKFKAAVANKSEPVAVKDLPDRVENDEDEDDDIPLFG